MMILTGHSHGQEGKCPFLSNLSNLDLCCHLECQEGLGMESGAISDRQIKASSQ